MKLIQTLEKSVHGYWDGGAKQTFEWTVENHRGEDKQGRYVRIGSWTANHWFHVAEGKTEKLSLRNAMLHLRAAARKRGLASTFKYVEART